MSVKVFLNVCTLALCLGMTSAIVDAGDNEDHPSPIPECPDNVLGEFSGKEAGFSIRCRCPSVPQGGTVFGGFRNLYTCDSNLCRAVQHRFGTVADEVTVVNHGAQLYFLGSEANGIETVDWGRYSCSYSLTSDAEIASPPASDPIPECPRNLQSVFRGQDVGLSLQCTCSSVPSSGNVWGGPPGSYTCDSSVCRAAQHRLGSVTGTLTVVHRGPQSPYTGSTANGISSDNFGSWDCSYDVAPTNAACQAKEAHLEEDHGKLTRRCRSQSMARFLRSSGCQKDTDCGYWSCDTLTEDQIRAKC